MSEKTKEKDKTKDNKKTEVSNNKSSNETKKDDKADTKNKINPNSTTNSKNNNLSKNNASLITKNDNKNTKDNKDNKEKDNKIKEVRESSNEKLSLKDISLANRKHEEELRKKAVEEECVKVRQRSLTIDKRKIYKLNISYYCKEEEKPKLIQAESNEIWYDFKKRLFGELKQEENKHEIFLANKIITNMDSKMLNEVFELDKSPIIEIRKKVVLGKNFTPKIVTKVSIENYPTVTEIFNFLNKYLEDHKYPRYYKEEIKNNQVIISFENSEVAYGFLKALNNEKYLNNLYAKIKTSLYAESQLKHPGISYLENRPALYPYDNNLKTSQHIKNKNPYAGTLKNSLKTSSLENVIDIYL
jgi:hypothetical protein